MTTHAPVALVAGAAGLIGSSLCRQLLDHGISVVAVDNFLTGSEANLVELNNHPSFQLIRHDICEPLAYPGPLQSIYHLASPASPEDFDALALEILSVNSQGTRHLLELAHEKGAKLLFASTSEVYGNPEVHPQKEDYWGHVNPVGPRSCYDESKRFGESLVSHYARLHGTQTVIARIFNTYGPRMRVDDGRVVPEFLRAALEGRPLELHGGGQQTRSFCYVDDLVKGLMGLMKSKQTTGNIYNIGNPQEYTMEVLATAICELADVKLELKGVPSPRIDDPQRRRPDISRIHNEIGWQPQVALREGLARTLADFQARLQS